MRPVANLSRSVLESSVELPLLRCPRPSYRRGYTEGLSEDRRTYVVETGDTGTRIAQRLVGDGNRWRELLATNPSKASAQYGIAVYTGDVLILPDSWIAQLGGGAKPTADAMPESDRPMAKLLLADWTKGEGAPMVPDLRDWPAGGEATDTSWSGLTEAVAGRFDDWWRQKQGQAGESFTPSGKPTVALRAALAQWAATKPVAPVGPVPDLVPIIPPAKVLPGTLPSQRLDEPAALAPATIAAMKVILAAWAKLRGGLASVAGYPRKEDISPGAWSQRNTEAAQVFLGEWYKARGIVGETETGAPTTALKNHLEEWLRSAPLPGFDPSKGQSELDRISGGGLGIPDLFPSKKPSKGTPAPGGGTVPGGAVAPGGSSSSTGVAVLAGVGLVAALAMMSGGRR